MANIVFYEPFDFEFLLNDPLLIKRGKAGCLNDTPCSVRSFQPRWANIRLLFLQQSNIE